MMNYSCDVRLLWSNEIIITSFDVIEPKNTADWTSLRMVRLSKEAINLCFADSLKNLLYSKKLINPQEIDPKLLLKNTAKFAGYTSFKQLNIHSKIISVYGNKKGELEFVPMKYERDGSFSFLSNLTLKTNFNSADLLEKLYQAFELSVGSYKWILESS